MNSPRYAPAGLLIERGRTRVAIDAGPGAEQALRHGVRRLVFAHIGRPTIAALDAGLTPPFGEIGIEGDRYTVTQAA